jgi:NADH dehydrogenase
MEKKKVVIVGAGFAGIQLARKLDPQLFEVWVLDKLNHHQFQPLFYQVATSQIEPSSISFPLRNVFSGRENIQVRMAEVKEVQTESKKVITDIGAFSYDILVLSMGCKTNFFNDEVLAQHALPLKSSFEAIAIRNHVLRSFEKVLSASEEQLQSLMNLVIVGAGPTGVELAGAFADIKKYILPKDFPGVDWSNFTIHLVSPNGIVLNAMSEYAQANGKRYLQEMGVNIISNERVESYDGKALRFKSGLTIPSETVIWAAGVTPNTLQGWPETVEAKAGRLVVDRYNKLKGVEDVFVLGDQAYMETEKYPKGHPQVANVAINQAVLLANNLGYLAKGKSLIPYEYKDLGSMATIGRSKALVDIKSFKLKGYWAWVIWTFLHLMLILSVRNKLIIFINWQWAYFSKNTALRLILQPEKRKEKSNA